MALERKLHFPIFNPVMNFLRSIIFICRTKAEENTLAILYNDDSGDDLNALHYKLFQEKVKKNHKYIDAIDLLPTLGSAKFHRLRVYYQVQQRKGETGHINPKQWGCEINNDQLIPMKTDVSPAPKDLHIFMCNCKIACSSKRCTCRKHGLECTFAMW